MRRRQALLILAAAVAATAMVAACSSGTKGTGNPAVQNSTSSTANSIAGSTGPATVAAANPANPADWLLSVNDLPAGWAVDNSASDNSGGPACLAAAKNAFKAPEKAEANFSDGNITGLVNAVAAYPDAAAANAGYGRGAGVFDTCKDVSYTQNGTKVTGSIGAMSFSTIGETSKAWAIKLSAQGLTIGIDVVLILKGAAIEEVAFLDLGSPDVDQLKTFCDAAYAKLP